MITPYRKKKEIYGKKNTEKKKKRGERFKGVEKPIHENDLGMKRGDRGSIKSMKHRPQSKGPDFNHPGVLESSSKNRE